MDRLTDTQTHTCTHTCTHNENTSSTIFAGGKNFSDIYSVTGWSHLTNVINKSSDE